VAKGHERSEPALDRQRLTSYLLVLSKHTSSPSFQNVELHLVSYAREVHILSPGARLPPPEPDTRRLPPVPRIRERLRPFGNQPRPSMLESRLGVTMVVTRRMRVLPHPGFGRLAAGFGLLETGIRSRDSATKGSPIGWLPLATLPWEPP